MGCERSIGSGGGCPVLSGFGPSIAKKITKGCGKRVDSSGPTTGIV